MNRIEERFAQLKKENKKALIPYVSSGDPTLEKTIEIVTMLERAGADAVELGIPYSDPLADGPVIQAASLRSLSAGFTIDGFFDMVKKLRKVSQLPLVCMVYYSSILGYGAEKFVNNCVEADLDGLIVPDLPYEELDELKPYLEKTDLCLIPFVAITSGDRIKMLTEGSRGFVYCVSSLGVTGERKSFDTRIDNFVKSVKAVTDTPVCIGFGISSKEDVQRFERVADGVIMGSAIVRKLYENADNLAVVEGFVKSLK